MAWQNCILRVNLTKLTCTPEPLNREWAEQYLGQRGLGSKYLVEEIDPTVDPLSPENKLIIATGPLTGTTAPTGGRSSAITKGALTNTIAASNTGGMFGAELKMAGYDLLIVEGRAETPVYLRIHNDDVEICSAEHWWGKTVWETEPGIKKELNDERYKVASVGRAGELGVLFACIVNDMDRAFGRSGVGAVMGSKNLKAIAVLGSRGVKIKDPMRFQSAVKETSAVLKDNPIRQRFSNRGTHNMMDVTHQFGALPTNNARNTQFHDLEGVNADSIRIPRKSDGKPSFVRSKACFACTIACGRLATIDPESPLVNGSDDLVGDRSRYKGPSGGLEYENAYAFGPMCGVSDLDSVNYANFLCNEHGMDPISLGASISAAMELFEEGAITIDNTDGVELRFGSAEALVRCSEWTALGHGIGRDIGMGAERLCKKYGHPEFSMTVKGQEFPGYDPRALKGMGLAYATSNRGCCHMRARPLVHDFANVENTGKAELVKTTQDFVAAYDSSGMCVFTSGMFDYDYLVSMLDAACEGDWSKQRLDEIGERIWNMERQFNNAAGFTREDDTLPQRVLSEPAQGGSGEGQIIELESMLNEYYEYRGWTDQGVPTPDTLKRLGL